MSAVSFLQELPMSVQLASLRFNIFIEEGEYLQFVEVEAKLCISLFCFAEWHPAFLYVFFHSNEWPSFCLLTFVPVEAYWRFK